MTDHVRTPAAVAVGLAAACLFNAPAEGGHHFQIVDLGTLGGSISLAYSINESGVIAGAATTTASVKHAVRWDDAGVIEDAGVPAGFTVGEARVVGPNGELLGIAEGEFQQQLAYRLNGSWVQLGVLSEFTNTEPAAINDSGVVVGRSYTLSPDFSISATRWINDAPQALPSFQGGRTWAKSINDSGDVVGLAEFTETDFEWRAALWTGGTIVDLGVLSGESFSMAADINNNDQIVGRSSSFLFPQLPARGIATLWDNGQIIALPSHPDFIDCEAVAINDDGLIVGTASTLASAVGAAVLWEDGQIVDLGDRIPADSDWVLLAASDINNGGRIVGIGTAPNGELHGFLLIPISPGDVDQNGIVDVQDLFALLAAWGPCDQSCQNVDFDGSGVVDVFDLFILLANWDG